MKLSKILISSHWLFSNKFFRWYKYARPITVHIPRLRRRLRVASSLLATGIASTTVFINHWHCIFCLSFCLCPRLSVYTRLLLPRVRRLRVASSLLGLHLLLSSSITGIFCQSVFARVSTVCTPPPRRLLSITESSIFVLLF